jgi:hypothetical protein
MGGPNDPARLIAVATAGIAAMTVIRYAVKRIFSREESEEKDMDETPDTTRPSSVDQCVDDTHEVSSAGTQPEPLPQSEADMVRLYEI